MAGLALCMGGLAAVSGAAQAAELGAKDEPIKLALLEWTGNQVSAHIAGQLLEKLGYKVEYVTAGSFPHFAGLADGSLSASIEIWMNNVGDIFPKVRDAGQIEDLGNLQLETSEGWVYPKHMESICPGLPDWSALNKPECVAALAAPDTAPKGRFLDYPADWGSRAATILADNDMPYQAVAAGSEGALVAELDAATAAKTPLIMMFWGPHYALAQNEVGWVKMPPCKSQDNAHCINPPEVHKIVWSGFGAKWPAAHELLKQLTVNAAEQQKMMLRVDKGGEDIKKVVKEWVDANEAVWGPWVKAAGS
jgi:glycine betaine/proline transport system substrate-binding protein